MASMMRVANAVAAIGWSAADLHDGELVAAQSGDRVVVADAAAQPLARPP